MIDEKGLTRDDAVVSEDQTTRFDLWRALVTIGVVLSLIMSVGFRRATPTTTPSEPTAQPTSAVIDPNATPTAEFSPYDPALRPAESAAEHVVTLETTETELEVAPGIRQQMWTFGGTVPGPILRGKVGDLFTITLRNSGKQGHSIDLHASKVAWNDEMRTILPGQSLVYQFRAQHSGIFMYHCGTAPVIHHIGNGMYGAIVIDPPGLPPVARELLFVQSELYLGRPGGIGEVAKMLAERSDAAVFNGYVNQYRFRPIRVEPHERIRIWVLDAGPSENSSFHVVGTVFDTVYREGAYVLRRDGSTGGAQALDLQPAQGGFVELSFDEPGLYPFVTHKFSAASKGALGVMQAGDVATVDGASH